MDGYEMDGLPLTQAKVTPGYTNDQDVGSDPNYNTETQKLISLIRGSQNQVQAQQNPGLQDVSNALLTSWGSQKPGAYDDYLANKKKDRYADTDRMINNQANIVNQVRALGAQGDENAAAVDKAITRFAGDDPIGYEKILRELHNDPEPVTKVNAVTKAALAASKLGIRKPNYQSLPFGSRLVDQNTGEIKVDVDPALADKMAGKGTEFERLNARIQNGTATPQEIERANTIARGGKDTFTTETQKSGVKEVQQLRGQSNDADKLLGTTSMIRESLKGLSTGPIIGNVQAFTARGQEAISGLTRLALDSASMLKGSVSNYEDSLVQKSKPSVSNYPQANESILNAIEAQAQRIRTKQQFMEAWSNENHGNLLGSEQAWSDFINHNHIIAGRDEKTGELKLNLRNINGWEPYIKTMGGSEKSSSSQGRPPLESFQR